MRNVVGMAIRMSSKLVKYLTVRRVKIFIVRGLRMLWSVDVTFQPTCTSFKIQTDIFLGREQMFN